MDQWTPAAEGALTDLPATLQPLTPFKNKLLIVSGLADAPAFPLPGEGTGDHVRAAATFLTGVHPKKTDGPDIRGGTSMDQIAAGVLGPRDRPHVAGTRHRPERADRGMRSGLELRVRQHPVVAQSDQPAPDGEPAACGVRAPVRRYRRHDAGGASGPDSGGSEHPRLAGARGGRLSARAGAGRPDQGDAVPGRHPRHRAAHPGSPRRRATASCRSWRGRAAASPTPSKSTPA